MAQVNERTILLVVALLAAAVVASSAIFATTVRDGEATMAEDWTTTPSEITSKGTPVDYEVKWGSVQTSSGTPSNTYWTLSFKAEQWGTVYAYLGEVQVCSAFFVAGDNQNLRMGCYATGASLDGVNLISRLTYVFIYG